MKKLFVSQPMKGRRLEEIIAERSRLVEYAKQQMPDEEIEVINSILDITPGAHPLFYLGESLKLLSQADVAVFSRGWALARGCRIEYLSCVDYGIKVIF